jgi:hypothetical protein
MNIGYQDSEFLSSTLVLIVVWVTFAMPVPFTFRFFHPVFALKQLQNCGPSLFLMRKNTPEDIIYFPSKPII